MKKLIYHHYPIYKVLRYLFKPFLHSNRNCYKDTICYYDEHAGGINRDIPQSIISHPCPYFEGHGNNVLIGVKYWIEGAVSLRWRGLYYKYAPLIYVDGSFYYVKNGILYKNKEGKVIKLAKLPFSDYRYYDIALCDGYYAIRSGSQIWVSEDEICWRQIYDIYRGIKNSMIIVKRGGEHYLIFIEYSTGFQKHNHRILEFSFSTGNIRIIKEFSNRSIEEYEEGKDFARHIHVIQRDPFTEDIYVGTGDFDFEPGIYLSHDLGLSFEKLGFGSPQYRVLSFIFTEKSVFWNTDTPEKQFIYKYDRISKQISRYPLINGALWCTIQTKLEGEPFYIMSSNSEGAWFDNNNRVYGIRIKNEEPIIYELLKKRSKTKYSQMFPCCCSDKYVYLYNSAFDVTEKFILKHRCLMQ